MRATLSATAALAVAISHPATAQGRVELAPSSDWTLDYADDSCALRRMFGTGEDQAYLELRRFAPGTGLLAIVASNRMDPRNPPRVRYRFNQAGDWQDVPAPLNATLDTGFRGVIFEPSFVSIPELEGIDDPAERAAEARKLDLKTIEVRQAATTDSISVSGAFRRELTLRLGKLDAPIAALQACIDELVTHWNIDVEAHKTLSRPASPIDMAAASSMLGYPPKMARRSMPGLVHVRLAIDETGRITGCSIQMPLSDPEFAASSCADIQSAFEFEPALDKDGKPIASYWLTKVRFVMGGY